MDRNGLLAGIEIELDDGFKTYWRTPGESGLPPRFDWSGSINLARTDVFWPAPKWIEDVGGISYVYSHEVVLPLRLKTEDAAKPLRLKLSMDYGVCKDICIPAHADLELDVNASGNDRPLIEAAFAKVPRSQALGIQAAFSILKVTKQENDKPSYLVETRAPAGAKATLFAEGPDGWYFSVTPSGTENSFIVTAEEKPGELPEDTPLVLTLTADGHAIESEVHLDARARPR